MFLYKSVAEYAEAYYTIEKSRFIAHACPAESVDDAKSFIMSIKDKYSDATHNVPAFVIGPGMEHQWASDDGEPQGTSGMPILKFISSEKITNTAVVVTRYFGGIKLGTGGLARAYTHAVKLAIDKAGVCEVYEGCVMSYTLDYTYLSRIRNLSEENIFSIDNIQYTDNVCMDITCKEEDRADTVSLLADLTGGNAVKLDEEKMLVKIPV